MYGVWQIFYLLCVDRIFFFNLVTKTGLNNGLKLNQNFKLNGIANFTHNMQNIKILSWLTHGSNA